MYGQTNQGQEEEVMNNLKQYIGDGVYADFDGYAITLTTEDGIRTTNTIVLEPKEWEATCQYVEEVKRKKGK